MNPVDETPITKGSVSIQTYLLQYRLRFMLVQKGPQALQGGMQFPILPVLGHIRMEANGVCVRLGREHTTLHLILCEQRSPYVTC